VEGTTTACCAIVVSFIIIDLFLQRNGVTKEANVYGVVVRLFVLNVQE